jgi:protein-disulfide isomerase
MPPIARRLVIALAAAGLLAAACSKSTNAADDKTAPEMTLGSPNAKVTIIEYASITCPHCARFNEDVFPQIKKKYVDTGQVRYVFREFLTPPANVAAAGFLLARCAGKDKYFSVIDALFHSQNEIFSTGDVRGVLFRVGRGAGLTDDQITACIQDEAALKALNDRVEKAINVDKVNATPTFKIGDKTLQGEQPLSAFDAAIQPLLK